MRKAIFVVVVSFVLLVIGSSTAFATHCSVVNKPISAGEKFFVNTTTGAVTVTRAPNAKAGFATLDFNGDGVGDASVFALPVTPALVDEEGVGFGSLPDGAHNSGPGSSECDGKGIDDIAECGP